MCDDIAAFMWRSCELLVESKGNNSLSREKQSYLFDSSQLQGCLAHTSTAQFRVLKQTYLFDLSQLQGCLAHTSTAQFRVLKQTYLFDLSQLQGCSTAQFCVLPVAIRKEAHTLAHVIFCLTPRHTHPHPHTPMSDKLVCFYRRGYYQRLLDAACLVAPTQPPTPNFLPHPHTNTHTHTHTLVSDRSACF
jgi:hypothetical protein